MALLKVQINHPGSQKRYKKEGEGYVTRGELIVREWNKDAQHYRKFMCHPGQYVKSLDNIETQSGKLYFWGEWEGPSRFEPLHEGNPVRANGIHSPFHTTKGRSNTNTDPYVFGDSFKYSICQQRGLMRNLAEGTIILFGTTYLKRDIFVLDTVFVVGQGRHAGKAYEEARSGRSYSRTYFESTLRICKAEKFESNQVYDGVTFSQNPCFFSFTPCKTSIANGTERLSFKLSEDELGFSKKSQGISFFKCSQDSPQELWFKIAKKALSEGFVLGVQFDEPKADHEAEAFLCGGSDTIPAGCKEDPLPNCGPEGSPLTDHKPHC